MDNYIINSNTIALVWNNGKTYVYDKDFSEKNTGVAIYSENEDLEKTMEVEPIKEEDLFSDTSTDIFGEENE